MKLSLAKIISIILNPIVLAFFAPFFLIYKTTHDVQLAINWSLYTLIFISIFGLFTIISVKKKIITDMDISKREQRSFVYIVGILFSSIYLISLFFFHGPFILYFSTIGIIIGVSFLSIVNRKIKASIHTATITALILPVAISYGNYYYLLLFLIPLIIWARLKTKRHTPLEIFVGGTIGGFLSLSLYYIARVFLNK